MSDLHENHCEACEGKASALELEAVNELVSQIDQRWKVRDDQLALVARFEFRDYYQTMAFLNAVAFIANREGHHPDIAFGYNRVEMTWQTHAVGGITLNDLICASKVDRLLL